MLCPYKLLLLLLWVPLVLFVALMQVLRAVLTLVVLVKSAKIQHPAVIRYVAASESKVGPRQPRMGENKLAHLLFPTRLLPSVLFVCEFVWFIRLFFSLWVGSVSQHKKTLTCPLLGAEVTVYLLFLIKSQLSGHCWALKSQYIYFLFKNYPLSLFIFACVYVCFKLPGTNVSTSISAARVLKKKIFKLQHHSSTKSRMQQATF